MIEHTKPRMKNLTRSSLIALLITCSFISIYRINVVSKDEISWDVLGYYLYLPATFVHHDPMLNDIQWLKQLNQEQHLAGTLYMVSSNQKGEPMYFFLMGMAIFYLPFYFLATAFSGLFGFATDGFSLPFQYFLVIGCLMYTIIGLIYLRKILLRFFSEGRTAVILLVIVFGTNYINHVSLKNLETVNVLFMLVTLVIWNTLKWHETFRGKYLAAIGLFITLTVLVKPSEIFVALIPLLWNVNSVESIKEKFAGLKSNWPALFLTLFTCFLLVLPQIGYWHHKTGKFIYDSYVNAGVGLDYKSPHIFNILFSYRKGWLLYTPVIIFPLIGFYFLYKKNRPIFLACLVYFLISFYTISSWSEWWYGAGFSSRPFIATYPVLAICFGYFLESLSKQKMVLKILFWNHCGRLHFSESVSMVAIQKLYP